MILIAIIVAAFLSAVLLYFCSDGFSGVHLIAGIFGMILTVVTGVSAVVYAFAGWNWLASEHKTAIINREYQTNYTREEVFWASDVIDTIRELDRKRIELNGNIMQDGTR